eukprot:COSAG01_NODE_233_length_20982_cov_14.774458_5_plen_1039_part_00
MVRTRVWQLHHQCGASMRGVRAVGLSMGDFLRALAIVCLAVTGAQQQGGWAEQQQQHVPTRKNLLRNGGFEVGSRGWGVKFETWEYSTPRTDTQSAWAVTSATGTAAEGDRALRVVLARSFGLLARDTPQAEVMSAYFQGTANSTLTVSAAIRASATLNATLVIRYQPVGDRLGSLNLPTLGASFMLTEEWKRFSFTAGRLPGSQNNAYAVGLTFSAAQRTEVWLDAVCATPGRDVEYAPHAALEVGGHAGDANSLHEPGSPVPLEILLRNNRAQPSNLTITATVLSPGYQRAMFVQQADVVVPAASTLRATHLVRSDLLGPYRVYLDVREPGNTFTAQVGNVVAVDRFSFGVLGHATTPSAAQLRLGSRFGINTEASPNFTHSLYLARRAGFGHQRLMSAGFKWESFEPVQGHWDHAHENTMHEYVDLCRSYGMKPIALVGRGIPAWAQRTNQTAPPKPTGFQPPTAGASGAPPSSEHMQVYSNWMTRLAASFGQKLQNYESWNEPNSLQWYTGTPQQLAQTLMVQYKAIKAGNADATVIALSTMRIANSSSCTERNQLSPKRGPAGWDPAFCKVCWLQQVLRNMTQPASEFWDVLSWHPYRLGSGDPGPEAHLPGPPGSTGNSSVREEMQAVRAFAGGKKLFNTEWGWRIPSKFAPDEPTGDTIYASMPPDEDPAQHTEEDMAIFYVQQAATAYSNGVAVQYYFLLDEGAMTDRWEFGMVGRSQAYAKAIYFAAAAMIRRIDYAENLAQEQLRQLGDDVWLTVVTKDGAESLILWKARQAIDIEIKTSTTLDVSDIYGNTFSLHPGRDGRVYLTLTQSPLYIACSRIELGSVQLSSFQLISHRETVPVGQKTTSFGLTGTGWPSCSAVLQAGFLSTNTTSAKLAENMNILVPTDSVVVGEVYTSVLWLVNEGKPIGRLSSSLNVTLGDQQHNRTLSVSHKTDDALAAAPIVEELSPSGNKRALMSKPLTIMTVLIDDLGWADSQPRNPLSPTPRIGQLVNAGIDLLHHHVYMVCSPTRRSVLYVLFWNLVPPATAV